MTSIGFIPARAGSKRLPGKSLLPLCGFPLILYTLHAALVSDVDRVVISSDDPGIEAVANDYIHRALPSKLNKYSFHHRHSDLARDDSNLVDVVDDYLSCSVDKTVDELYLLQPTSPIRRAEDIDLAMSELREPGVESVVAVSEVMQHPDDMIRVSNNELQLLRKKSASQSQEHELLFFIIGSLYGVTLEYFNREKAFVTKKTKPLIMDPITAIDIDTSAQFELAEAIINSKPEYQLVEQQACVN